jgi:hypothetical protein
MKTIRKWLKTIALFFTALILFQSCATYKTPVTLGQAVQEEKAVKIITVDDDTSKYNYIVYEEGQFYGVKNNPGEDVKFPINSEEVTDVLKKEGGRPTWAIVVISVLGVIVLFLGFASGFFANGL